MPPSKAALTHSSLLSRLEAELGASHRLIEMAGVDLIKTVTEVTLPVFSSYYPWKVIEVVQKEDVVEGMLGHWWLKTPSEQGVAVLSISKMFADTLGYPGSWSQMNPPFANPVDAQIAADISSSIEETPGWVFHPPEQVEIRQKWTWPSSSITFELLCEHREDLLSIQPGIREQFIQLATLDCMRLLWAKREAFQNVNSPFGSLELSVDAWRDAGQKREELLEKFKAAYAKSSSRKKIFFG